MKKATFNTIVKQAKEKNSEQLWEKARIANQIAKRFHYSKRAAYVAKSKALISLLNNIPDHVTVSNDIKLTNFVIVEHKDDYSGLHLPVSHLA